jgi:hypothetical protein
MTITLVNCLFTDLCGVSLMHLDGNDVRYADGHPGVPSALGIFPEGAVAAADKDVNHTTSR